MTSEGTRSCRQNNDQTHKRTEEEEEQSFFNKEAHRSIVWHFNTIHLSLYRHVIGLQ